MVRGVINNAFKGVSNWWNFVPSQLDSAISSAFQGKAKDGLCSYIEANARSFVTQAKTEKKAIIIHPKDSLLRSLVVTPEGDFFLLLNRHTTENDKIIGAGGFKQVSLALHLNTGELYVSQRAFNELGYNQQDNQIELENNRQLLPHEASTHITHFVEYTSSGKQAGNKKIRFFSPFCNGGNLDTAIQENKLTKEQKDEIFTELCIAVCQMHQLGMVHRDLKALNVLLHNGKVVLTDFGTSGQPGMLGKFQHTEVVGTPVFLPPEVSYKYASSAENQTEAADIYSLGILFLELYGKELPKPIPFTQECKEDFHKSVLKAAEELADSFNSKLIRQMVCTNPAERISSEELYRRVTPF